MACNDVADDTVIGIEFFVLFRQLHPAPRLSQPHFRAVAREPLQLQQHAAVVKNGGDIGLVREDIAHRHPLIGDQHGKLRNGLRARPKCLINLRVLFGPTDRSQGNRLDQIERLTHADSVENILDRLEGLVLAIGRVTHHLEQQGSNAGILIDDARQQAHVEFLAQHELAQFIEHPRLRRDFDSPFKQTLDPTAIDLTQRLHCLVNRHRTTHAKTSSINSIQCRTGSTLPA